MCTICALGSCRKAEKGLFAIFLSLHGTHYGAVWCWLLHGAVPLIYIDMLMNDKRIISCLHKGGCDNYNAAGDWMYARVRGLEDLIGSYAEG
jgi:hypothetical protein